MPPWDETWAHGQGPYETENACRNAWLRFTARNTPPEKGNHMDLITNEVFWEQEGDWKEEMKQYLERIFSSPEQLNRFLDDTNFDAYHDLPRSEYFPILK